jgi:hypothetical protein
MKFKVGDKVRIIGQALDLKNYRGKEVEIIAVNEKYKEYLTSLNDDLWFEENELELINENNIINDCKGVTNNDKNMGKFESLGKEIGQLVDLKQKAYGNSVKKTYEIMQILLQDYDNGDGTYTIPKSLLLHMLLTVRDLDKTNRIFSNPDGDLMEEDPYADKTGYGLLGMAMVRELQ